MPNLPKAEGSSPAATGASVLGSARSLLYASAISFIVFAYLALSEIRLREFLFAPENARVATGILTLLLLLAFPVGYLIHGMSYFSLRWIEITLIESLLSSNIFLKRTKVIFNFHEVRGLFKVEDANQFLRAFELLRANCTILGRFGIDVTYFSSLASFARNISFIALVAIPHTLVSAPDRSGQVCVWLVIVAVSALILSAVINFYASMRALMSIIDLERAYCYDAPVKVVGNYEGCDLLNAILFRLSRVTVP